MELVDIQDLKSWGSNAVPVQLRPRVNLPLIDSHCHLDMVIERGLGVEEITQCLTDNGVGALIEIGADKEAMLWARTLAHTSQQFEVYYTIGHHPGDAATHAQGGAGSTADTMSSVPTTEDFEFGLKFIEENQSDKRFVAVGEIGLDYHYHADQADIQKQVFIEFVRAARRAGRGIAIHTRDAHADTFSILRDEAKDLPILIHCFTGTKSEMLDFLSLGAYISFSGIVTFKNAAGVQEAALACPLERMLIETDAPFLAPIPHRGRINQPGYVRHTLDFLAKLRGESAELIGEACTKNTRAFYAI